MRFVNVLLAVWVGLSHPVSGPAHEGGDPKEAKKEAVELVRKALRHIEAVGLEQAIADFKQPDNAFRDGELYVFVYDFQGANLANSTAIALPAGNLKEVRSRDGKLVIQEMIEMSKSDGGGAFEYDWINPQTGQIQSKISYFKRIPGFDGFVGCGYYR